MNSENPPIVKKRRGWQKGQSGNPAGRTPLSPEIREIRRLNNENLPAILNKFLDMDREQLNEVAQNPKTPAMELILIKVITEAVKHGDHHRLGFLFDRILGKQADTLNVVGLHLSLVRTLKTLEEKNAEDM
jgi:hypothetical protein